MNTVESNYMIGLGASVALDTAESNYMTGLGVSGVCDSTGPVT